MSKPKKTRARSPSIVYPQVSAEAWAARYELGELEPMPCHRCDKVYILDRPFAAGNWRGLTAEDHGCGTPPSVAKEFDEQGNSLWSFERLGKL